MTLNVYIGWDSREAVAADVCLFSMLSRSSVPLHAQMLRTDDMFARGLYWRAAMTRDGQRYDVMDGRPFSTDFSFTRFLVPALQNYKGWALFLDCDFLVLADIAELLPLLDDSKAALVCKQVHEPADTRKMDGQQQTRYRRKNWSSFMLLNCGHPDMALLTPEQVNSKPGYWLHGFDWLDSRDIGDIPHQWNWIDGVTSGEPKAVHFTAGGCWFPEFTNIAYAKEWRSEYAEACRKAKKEAA